VNSKGMRGESNMKKKNIVLNLIAAFALMLANTGASATSYLWVHQPKFPEKLRK